MLVEGSGRGLGGLPSQYFRGWTEKIHKKPPVIVAALQDQESIPGQYDGTEGFLKRRQMARRR
jgi:hypothetical protein